VADEPKQDPYSFDISDALAVGVASAIAASTATPPKTFWGKVSIPVVVALGAVGGVLGVKFIKHKLVAPTRKQEHPSIGMPVEPSPIAAVSPAPYGGDATHVERFQNMPDNKWSSRIGNDGLPNPISTDPSSPARR
jgi:hypothetical protein